VVLRSLGHTNRHDAPDQPVTSLRENALGVRPLTPGMLARAQAYLFAAAGVLGFVGVILPHPDAFNIVGLVSLQGSCLASAGLLLALGDRTPRWFITSTPFAGTLLISAALVYSGDSTSAYMLFFLWIGIYAFYFLPRGRAALLGGFAILNYAAVILLLRVAGGVDAGGVANGDIHDFVLITGTLIVAGVFIFTLRNRLGRLIDRLTDAASTDPLTGLLNRRGFHRITETELERARRAQRPFSMLLGDCDFFKLINDRFGHHAGDEALQGIARLLDRHKRRIDTAARIGGEEFAVILPETDQHEAYILAERLRSRIRALHEGEAVSLTMSFGVASYPVHGASADALLRAADEALYAAKALGRDRTVLHSAEVAAILNGQSDGRAGSDHAQLATVLSLAEALDVRDTGTSRHSQTVGRYAELMARALGLPREHVERIRLAGVLHDIGKIGVPDSILRKPGALTEEEYGQMRKHPEIGARILGGSGLDDIRRWILAHHERPDGLGYPFGLAGPEIPLEAKIVAVADAYEAMTSDRVYRPSIGAGAAREELRRHAGSQFDPRVVEAFLEMLARLDEDEGEGEDGTVAPLRKAQSG
jgi:diguanylate cyclase (GGDEF)-like protein/putative nucleotidyltransferase with HDIG domain